MNDADQIEVKTEVLEEATIVKPIGEIDLSRAPSLRHHLNEAQASKPGSLVIDLSEVPYMDSSGVATLVEAMQIARRNKSRIILCSMQERVKSIFEIARLDVVFTIVENREIALQS